MISLSKWIGKSSAGIEPMSDKDPPFLAASSANRGAGAARSAAIRASGARGPSTRAPGAPLKTAAREEAPAGPVGRLQKSGPEQPPSEQPPSGQLTPRLTRAETLKGHLDMTLERVQHARADADQLFALICDLEAEAKLGGDLVTRNQELAHEVEESQLEITRLTEGHAELSGEVARLRHELERAQAAREEAEREASAAYLANQRDLGLRTELSAEINLLRADLDGTRAAKEAIELDCSSLRAMLAERESALRALQAREAELRVAGEKDAAHIAELSRSVQRKDTRIIELTGALEKNDKRIEQLEERHDCTLEEQRQLEVRHRDLQIATESRIYSLTSSLSQEQAGHRVTRKLLDEMRSGGQMLADENKQLKDQALALAQENQQMKIELGGTRGTIREYGERLGELNLRYGAAQDDVERLESALNEARKDARALKRRASKVEDLQSDNANLQDKITSLQNMLEQYRGGRQARGDDPIVLKTRRAGEATASAATRGLHEEKLSATVTPLPRAQ